MVKRLGLVILVLTVLALTVTGLGPRDEKQTGGDAAPIAGPAIRPLDVVSSSVSRGLASLHPQRIHLNAAEGRRAEIHRAADDLFDVDDMARRVLGQHWKSLLPQEQDEFVRLFRDVLTQSFVTIVERYSDNVTSLDEVVGGTFARVRSRIAPEQGPEIAIEYRLSQSGSQWMVYDIVLNGASLVANYRSHFNSLIGTSSVARLLERMRTEQTRRPQPRDPATAEFETPARVRLAAGLLLGVGAASYARRR